MGGKPRPSRNAVLLGRALQTVKKHDDWRERLTEPQARMLRAWILAQYELEAIRWMCGW